MRTIDLNGAWQGECLFPDHRRLAFEGRVPGCAISDLIRAQKLPRDIFWRDNANSVSEFEPCDYIYKKEFMENDKKAYPFISRLRAVN